MKQIDIDNFDYELPDQRIAIYPLEKRDSSKLLVYNKGEIYDSYFDELVNFLPSDSFMVFNNSKVIQARMHFRKATGAQIEIFCLEPHTPHDYALIFQETKKCSWVCLIGNLKKWKEGSLEKTILLGGKQITITAIHKEANNDSHVVEFTWDDDSITFADILDAGGELPIPPYLNRDTEEQDKETYQTVYSKIKGSVAAPTAGLHFTRAILKQLKAKGIKTDEVTLHVGAGTFKPVKTNNVNDHVMHSELISVSRDFIQNLINHSGKVIAVGTTSVRTLESLYYIGVSLLNNSLLESLNVTQFQPYENENKYSKIEALEAIITYLDRHKLNTLVAETQIMIKPGYVFRVVEGIVTNFHQPKSTLLLLIAAFVCNDDSEKWKNIYKHALTNEYRFLSYGDSSLLLP